MSASSSRGLLAIAVLALVQPAMAAEEPAPRRPLVLQLVQDEELLASNAAFQAEFRIDLPPTAEVELTSEHLNGARSGDRVYLAAFRQWLLTRYSDQPPVVIVALGEGAIAFLADPETNPWPGVPVVFGVVDDRSPVLEHLPPNFTGVAEHIPVRETMELALRLLPGTRRVALFGGVSSMDRSLAGVLRREVTPYQGRLEVIDLIGQPMEKTAARVRALPEDSIVIGISNVVDGAGRRWSGPQIVKALTEPGTAPLFTMFSHIVGAGSMGGVSVDFGETGHRTAHLVERLLAGEPVRALPVEHGGPYGAVLDWRQLRRWSVPEDRVPAGAELRFREPSFWRRYRWQAASFIAALALQTALIAFLLLERRRRRSAERSARENLAVVAHMNRVGAIGELAGSFAHELNSPLAAVVNNAQAARRLLAQDGPKGRAEVAGCLEDIVADAHRAGEVVRRMRGALRREDLHPVPLDLAAILRDAVRLVEADARDRGVVVSVEVAPHLPKLRGDDVQLVQVVLNLVMNAVDALGSMPAERRRVAVSAAPHRGGAEIQVVDTGPGVAPAELERIFEPFVTTKPGGLGLGLAISRSIVEAHGGTIRASLAPDGGTVFRVFLPRLHEARAASRAAARRTTG